MKEDVGNQKEETWTTDNVRDPTDQRGRDEASYFDPSYDYMGQLMLYGSDPFHIYS